MSDLKPGRATGRITPGIERLRRQRIKLCGIRAEILFLSFALGVVGVAMSSNGRIDDRPYVQGMETSRLDELISLRRQNQRLLSRLDRLEEALAGQMIAAQRTPESETNNVKFIDPMKAFRAKVKLALASELNTLKQHSGKIQKLEQDVQNKVNKSRFDAHTHSFSTVKTAYMTQGAFDNCNGCLLHVTAPHNVGKSGKKVTSPPE